MIPARQNMSLWQYLPYETNELTSPTSLSSMQWQSPNNTSIFPAEIWGIIGSYVALDLADAAKADRRARPYGKLNVGRLANPQEWAEHLPWVGKARLDFRKRWWPLYLYKTISPLRMGIDDYFRSTWIQNASIWVCQKDSSTRRWWVSMFEEFRGFNNEYAVLCGSWIPGQPEPDGNTEETNAEMANVISTCDDTETGYHSEILMRIEAGLTDLLPLDLNYPTAKNGYRFIFRWRPYIDLLFVEQRRHMLNLVEGVNHLYTEQGLSWNMTIAANMVRRHIPLHAFKGWVHNMGDDGRDRSARRARRVRLGTMQGILNSESSYKDVRRHAELDEVETEHKMVQLAQEFSLEVRW